MAKTETKDYINDIKLDLLRMFYHSHTGHFASALSCVEIIGAVFVSKNVGDDMILSKGHGAAALYAFLAREGYIDREELLTYYDAGTRLTALASPTIPGIRVPTGSLGQGICYATGLAKAAKLDGNDDYIYCILGDGEMQEGSVWEAATFSYVHRLSNLIVILDHNHIQAGHKIGIVSDDQDVSMRWKGFHWNVIDTDGHDVDGLIRAISELKRNHKNDRPNIIVAETRKGNGIHGIEGEDDCHMKNPKEDEWDVICSQFNISRKDLVKI